MLSLTFETKRLVLQNENDQFTDLIPTMDPWTKHIKFDTSYTNNTKKYFTRILDYLFINCVNLESM